MVRNAQGEWSVTVHRDQESIQSTWMSLRGDHVAAVVHVGFDRPDTDDLEEMAKRFQGILLMSGAARYAFAAPHVAEIAAGIIKDIPFYAVLSGWGYSSTTDKLGLEESLPSDWESSWQPTSAAKPAASLGWVAGLALSASALAKSSEEAGIVDDESYLLNECRLSDPDRICLAEFRLARLAGGGDTEDPVVLALYGPPWLLKRSFGSMDLSVRIDNVFRRENINVVADLQKFITPERTLKFQNFGRKSYVELGEVLASELRAGPINSAAPGEPISTPQTDSLLQAVRTDLSNLPSRACHILRRRIGIDEKFGTLQEIADEFGVTRERVRQVEAKSIARILKISTWPHQLQDALTRLLRQQTTGLSLAALEVLDRWFTGLNASHANLGYLLQNFCSDEFYLLTINGTKFISELSPEMWEDVVSRARHLLEAGVKSAWSEEQAQLLVEALLTDTGRELRSELWACASRHAHFAKGEEGAKTLVSVGRGAEQIVEAVLTDSVRPLHFTEITELASQRAGRQYDSRLMHNAAARVAFLYERGTYGLLQHLPLNSTEQSQLLDQVMKIIESGPDDRQWHAAEICAAVKRANAPFSERVTPYIVNIILLQAGRLSYLGRLVWTKTLERKLTSADRIAVHQAITVLLQEAGRPLSTTEIRDRLSEKRGLGPHFQIHPFGSVIRMADGNWGLVERDLEAGVATEIAMSDEKWLGHTQTDSGPSGP